MSTLEIETELNQLKLELFLIKIQMECPTFSEEVKQCWKEIRKPIFLEEAEKLKMITEKKVVNKRKNVFKGLFRKLTL